MPHFVKPLQDSYEWATLPTIKWSNIDNFGRQRRGMRYQIPSEPSRGSASWDMKVIIRVTRLEEGRQHWLGLLGCLRTKYNY